MSEGRDARGRFAKGHQLSIGNGGGRPDKATRDSLRAIIDANVSCQAVAEAWKRVESILLTGGRGWMDFLRLYLDYRYGKPAQFVDLTSNVQQMPTNVIVVRQVIDSEPTG